MFPLIPRERGKEGRKKEGRGEEKRVGRKWRRGREGGREGRKMGERRLFKKKMNNMSALGALFSL